MAWFKCGGEVLDDYTGVTVDAGAVTSDGTYTYLTIPKEGKFDTSSKVRTKNSNLSTEVAYASGNTVIGGSSSETKTTSVTLNKGKYIVCWTSYSCASSDWQSHGISVSGGTYTTLKRLQFACSTDTCYSDCYLVEITSDSGTVTGSYKRQSSSTRTAVGALHAVKVG